MSTVATEKGKDAPLCSCPAACGFMISGRDPHTICIACMGVKLAQAALVDAESCAHCHVMPARILERMLHVAASSKDDPCLSTILWLMGSNSLPCGIYLCGGYSGFRVP